MWGTEERTRPDGQNLQLLGGVESSDAGASEERLGDEARGGGTEERHDCSFRCESGLQKGCCLKHGGEREKLRQEVEVPVVNGGLVSSKC